VIAALLSAVVVCTTTAVICWTWIFRNYAINTANWLDDLVEYLSTEENKYKYEINGITADLLPKLERVDVDCTKRFVPLSLVWALSVINLMMILANTHDLFVVTVVSVGVVYAAFILYTDDHKYQYLKKEMIDQQLTFDQKAEDDEHADA
jgi:hypothetical protein